MWYYGLLLFQKQLRFVHFIHFPSMFYVNLCLLNKPTRSISSIADLFSPLFPTRHGLLAVTVVYKGGR
jgi:hypothetical protein